MPVLFVYNASDFIGGLPDEADSAAGGLTSYVLTLSPLATPYVVKVSDDDNIFDEVDSIQSLAEPATINGVSYAAGTSIHAAYDLIDTASGHMVSSFHMGGDGYQQGAVVGLVSTKPLTVGEVYTFDLDRTSNRQSNFYADYVTCFASGTRIATERGETAVERLRAGDLICTQSGPKPVRTVLSRTLSGAHLRAAPNMRPIRITKGSLGAGRPHRDLIVSPQHRLLVRSDLAQGLFGRMEVLVAARKLTALPGIRVISPKRGVSYHHLVLSGHDIIFAEGAPTESYFPGPAALRTVPPATLAELHTIFPHLGDASRPFHPARPIPPPKQQAQLIARHRKSGQPILSTSTRVQTLRL